MAARLYFLHSRKFHRVSSLFQVTEGEKRIIELIKTSLSPSKLSVKDISGGCGSMYEIDVTSSMFKGRRLVQQHQMVNNALKEEFKDMHGLIIRTHLPE
jgi:stress-induced morphogen